MMDIMLDQEAHDDWVDNGGCESTDLGLWCLLRVDHAGDHSNRYISGSGLATVRSWPNPGMEKMQA